MARLNYAEYDDAPESLRQMYDRLPNRPNNVLKMFGNSPELFSENMRQVEFLFQASVLGARLRELVTLAVARKVNCPYVWARHAQRARAAGVTEEELATLRKDGTQLSGTERAALRYAEEVVGLGQISDETFSNLSQYFDVKEIVELTYFATYYSHLARFIAALQVDIDPDVAAELKDGEIA